MKSAVRAVLAAAGRVGLVWQLFSLLDFVSRCLAEPLHQADMARRQAADADMAMRLSPSLVVLHGPFAGMRYPKAQSAGSTLVPKILGSYERELHFVIDRVLRADYSDIVDIGCAEGYYAVGLGMRHSGARIHAFDIDPGARRLCRDMAVANDIADRLVLGGLCDENTLLTLPLGPRALVISDCEGYEAHLFTRRIAEHLSRHDVLIEVHDHAAPELGTRLRAAFRATHECLVIDSIDDTRKLRSYVYTELDGFDVPTRRYLLSEGRGMAMEWLFLTPRVVSESVPRAVAARLVAV